MCAMLLFNVITRVYIYPLPYFFFFFVFDEMGTVDIYSCDSCQPLLVSYRQICLKKFMNIFENLHWPYRSKPDLGIHRCSVNSPQKGPVTRKMFPFDDVIMLHIFFCLYVNGIDRIKHSAIGCKKCKTGFVDVLGLWIWPPLMQWILINK